MNDLPKIRTLDQFLALADGGHFAPDFYDRLNDFWEALHTFTVLHQNDAKGEITLKIPVQMARHGEITIAIKAEVKLPELPKQEGRARAFLNKDGTITQHPQQEMGLFRDVKKDTETRDPEQKDQSK